MSSEFSGRILRPRQFVPMPPEWCDHRMIREDWAGRIRWRGMHHHPEVANLIQRHEALMVARVLRGRDDEVSDRVEALLLHATDFYEWWFMQMDPERLLPDSSERPDPEAVMDMTPSWQAFLALIGAIHRARRWIEAVERRQEIKQATAAEIWAQAYGVDVADVAP